MAFDIVVLFLLIVQGALFYRLFYKRKKSSKIALIDAKVLYVFDGDTVSVSIKGREVILRLDSIDCPESKQAWGNIATAGLIKLIGGRTVQLETYGLDIYNRTLATVYVKNGNELVNVNERMVKLGHAWVYRYYYNHLSEARKGQLNLLESMAILNRRGLWRNENPVAPWDYRRLQRAN